MIRQFLGYGDWNDCWYLIVIGSDLVRIDRRLVSVSLEDNGSFCVRNPTHIDTTYFLDSLGRIIFELIAKKEDYGGSTLILYVYAGSDSTTSESLLRDTKAVTLTSEEAMSIVVYPDSIESLYRKHNPNHES